MCLLLLVLSFQTLWAVVKHAKLEKIEFRLAHEMRNEFYLNSNPV